MEGISRKIYLEMEKPTEADARSGQERILDALRGVGIEACMTIGALREIYPLCDDAQWNVTASLAWDGNRWQCVRLEAGNTEAEHYGLAVDLGSTSVVMQLVDCSRGTVLCQESVYNHQIAYGEDILNRIFYSRDDAAHLEELRRATIETFLDCMEQIRRSSGKDPASGISMCVAGNTTMMHFLLGMDAFCVFSSPYAVHADQPGFLAARDLELPLCGYVFCYPGKANYLGGDIISGMVATGMYRRSDISLFFDVGTNGELVVGNRDFLLCGAGAAGPALEGGVVKTGMRAARGAVEHVRLLPQGETFALDVIGGGAAKGICGSGIVDLLSELFLNGWVDLRGQLQPECSPLIGWREEAGEYAVCCAPGLWFYQSDINEFLRTKAAAATMMEYLLQEAGMELSDVHDFYMAGAFGTHICKEAAVNIGMYPDVEPERIHTAGNSSLDGARMLLLDRTIPEELTEILSLMSYVQFGAVEDFLTRMVAASALPHTDLERYPNVMRRLEAHRSMHV